MKKKILSMLIILVLALSLCACGKSSDEFDKEEYIANAINSRGHFAAKGKIAMKSHSKILEL